MKGANIKNSMMNTNVIGSNTISINIFNIENCRGTNSVIYASDLLLGYSI